MKHFYKLLFFFFFFGSTLHSRSQITCNFTLFDTVECNQLAVLATPTETSGSAITQRCWNLVGGISTNYATGCGNNPTFSYIATECGSYLLTLRSRNANGDSCTISKQVRVACPPVIDVTFTPTQGCQPFQTTSVCNIDPVDGALTSIYYVWGCGGRIDTFTSCPPTPILYTYINCPAGCVSPTVIATNQFGCTRDSTFNCAITINPCPIARFTADTTYAYCANNPLPVVFTADSTLPNSTFTWFVDGAQEQSSPSRTFNRTFPISPNCYTVRLIVTQGGYSDTSTRVNYICVNSSSPVQFTQNFDTVCINAQNPATLVLNNTNAGDLTWTVTGPQNFPPVVGPTASFPITALGTYTLNALADYGPGCTNSITQQVLVANLRPVASFTLPTAFACSAPYTLSLSADPCSGCTYDWAVIRPSVSPSRSSLQNPTFNLIVYATYQVRLIVRTPNGCADTLSRNFVLRRINPQIGLSSAQGCPPVCFTALDNTNYSVINDPVTSVCWSFPGSSFADSCSSSSFPYGACVTAPGCFNAKLRVTTASGCVDSVTSTSRICVGTPPNCTLSATPRSLCFGTQAVAFSLSCDSFSFARVNYGVSANTWVTVTTRNFSYNYPSLGTFPVQVRVFYNNCTDSSIVLRDTIRVLGPVANFTNASTCALGDTINFTNQTTPTSGTTYQWTYSCNSGASESSTATNPRFVFAQCDTCQVNLTAFNSQTGCTNSTSRNVITNCPALAIAPNDTAVCRGRPIRFINLSPSTNRTRWDFIVVNGQFIPTNTGNPITSPAYNTPGDFIVGMENRTTSNCLDTAYARVRVCDTAMNFTFTNSCYPSPICFNSFVTDSFCPITLRVWSYGDGTTDTGAVNPCHVYPGPGTYTVTLTIRRDNNACLQSVTRVVTVAGNLNYSYNIDTIICPGVQQCITNNSTGTNLTFDWVIPNALPYDTFASNPGPCFTINTPGDYVAHFSVSSDSLCFNRDSVILHVNQPAATGFVSIDTLPCPNPPVPIFFTTTSLYIDSSFSWDFGNGRGTTLRNPTNIYTQPGEYIVCLTVTDNDGCTDTRCIDTIVIKGPYGSLALDPVEGVCACKDSLTITVSSVYASEFILVYGCNQGSAVSSINPIGTPGNPSISQYQIPYCVLDTCKPQLIVRDSTCVVYDDGNISSIVIDSPVVAFTFNNYGVCNNGVVCFQDATTYTLDSTRSFTIRREWDFGDSTGVTDSVANPCHYYANPGAYYPILRIWSNVGCFDSITTQVVVVSDYPVASYYADDTLFCEDNTTCFHDSSTIFQYATASFWTWNFGDGSPIDTSTVPDVCHFYSDGGFYRITMCVYDSLGCPDCDSSLVIRVITDPVADAGGDRTLCYGVPTTLNGSGGQDFLWSPSSLFPVDDVPNPTVVLTTNSVVVLQVGDQFGCTDTDTIQLTMDSVNAIFSLGASYCLNNNICPVDQSTSLTGSVNNWSWDFGDSTILTGQAPCHRYIDTGFYTVFLTAADNHGCIDTTSRVVYLYTNPESLFSLNDTAICSYQQLCVTDLSTSGAPIITWNWNYGTPAGNVNGPTPPCYSFIPPYLDTYTITLVITDVNQCRDTSSIDVTFYEAPTANFNWNPSCENEAMPLINTSIERDALLASCEWVLWLGSPTPVIDNNCNTSFQFPPGSHNVQLAIVDLNGCVDTVVKTVFTDSLTQLILNPGDTTICLGTPLQYTVQGVFDNVSWNPQTWLSDPNSPVVIINPLGNVGYVITAVNGVCDPVSESITIRTLQPIPIDLLAVPDRIVLGMSSDITSQIPGRIDSIVWNPDSTLDCRTCPNPVATPTQTTTYAATIYFSQNGVTCTNTGFVTIEVLNSCNQSIVYLPNTFTPNGDGLNDVFMIRGIAATKINYFRIFDRWGKLVFETSGGSPNDPSWGWDGNTPGGKALDTGVYVYNYEIRCVNGDVVSGKGNVTLIR